EPREVQRAHSHSGEPGRSLVRRRACARNPKDQLRSAARCARAAPAGGAAAFVAGPPGTRAISDTEGTSPASAGSQRSGAARSAFCSANRRERLQAASRSSRTARGRAGKFGCGVAHTNGQVMSSDTVSVTFDDGIAIVVIDNPPVNTINASVRTGLDAAAEQIEARSDVRAVVVRCAGSTFLSGADIGEFDGPPREEHYRRLFNRYEALAVPVVAAMHGTVLGGGLEFALACHFRIASPGTRLGLPEVTLGIIPGAGGTQRMPRLIGVEKTIELVLSGRPIDAERALELGILDRIVDGDLAASAMAFARERSAAGQGPRRTGERKVDPATATDEIVARLTERAKAQYPNRQAALTAIDAIAASARLPLRSEERRVGKGRGTAGP